MGLMSFVTVPDFALTAELFKRVLRRLLTSEQAINGLLSSVALLFENLSIGSRTTSLNAKIAQLTKAVVEELRLIEEISSHNDPESYDQFKFWRKQAFGIWESYYSDLELAIIQNRTNDSEENFTFTEIVPVGREPICIHCYQFGHLPLQCESYTLRAEAEEGMVSLVNELPAVDLEEDLAGLRRVTVCLRHCERLIGPFWTDRGIQMRVIDAFLSKLPANIGEVYMARPARKTVRSLLHFLNKIVVGLKFFQRMKAMIKPIDEEWTFHVEDEEAYTRNL